MEMEKEREKLSSRGENKDDNLLDHQNNDNNAEGQNDTKINDLDRQKQDDDIDNPTFSEPLAGIESKNDDAKMEHNEVEADKKEEDKAETNIEESSSSFDIDKVSEEIDQFISGLAISNGDVSEQQRILIFIDQFAVLVEAKIATYDHSTDSPTKWSQLTEEEESSFLDTVDRISKLLKSLCHFSSESNYALSINRIGGILQRSISYLEDEFRSILEDYKIYDLDHDSSSKGKQETDTLENNFPGYSDRIVSKLNKLTKVLMSESHDTECYEIYFFTRRNALEESLSKLGFEKHSLDDLQKMQWEQLEKEIVAWIRTFKEFATMLFPNERKLLDKMFTNYTSTSESLFHSLLRGVLIQLLNFAEAVSMTKRSSEKLFKLLDVYETLRDQIGTMAGLCSVESLDEFKHEASLTRNRLGESMIYIFSELENSIKADTGKTPTPGGAVHPLTRYTMNYLKYAYEYKDTLEQVFEEHSKIDRDYTNNTTQVENDNNETMEKQSRFQLQLTYLMDLLETNLETKSKLYKDPSLSLIFLMNNGRYIMQKIKGSGKNNMMSDDWCRKRYSDLRNYHKNYQRETWGKLLQCLNPEGLLVKGKVSKPVLKERFKSFNSIFDEIHKTQCTWVVSDEQLQSELRVSISAVVTPAYRSFVGRFSQVFTPGRQVEKYIKFQPEDVETYIDDLFDGNSTSVGTTNPGSRFW